MLLLFFVAFALLIVFLSLILTNSLKINSNRFSFHVELPACFSDVRLYICVVIILVWLIGPLSNSDILYADWLDIQPLNIINLVCIILTTQFFPGYLLLRILLRKSDQFSILSKLIFGFMLSMFIVPLIPYGLLLNNVELFPSGHTLLLLLNVVLLVISLIKDPLKFGKKQMKIALFSKENVFLLLIILAVLLLSYGVYGFQLIQDQRTLLGYSFLFDTAFPTVENVAFPYTNWWLQVFLRFFETLSSVPAINSYYSLNFLNIIPVLSLYKLLDVVFSPKNPNLKYLSTFFAFFSGGFGWIYAAVHYLCLPQSWTESIYVAFSKTYDVLTVNSYFAGHPDITSRLQILCLPAMFMLIFILKKEVSNKSKFVLTSLLVTVGYLGHAEFLFITAVLVLFFLFGKKQLIAAIATLFGFFLIAVIDFIAPGQYYTALSLFSVPYLLIAGVCVALATLISLLRSYGNLFMGKIKLVIEFQFSRISAFFSKLFVKYCFWFLVSFLCLFCFVVWIFVVDDFHPYLFATTTLGFTRIPFFIYPIKFGILGLFAVVGFVLFNFYKKFNGLSRELFVFNLWILVALLLRFVPAISEHRLNKHLMVPVSIFGALAICSLFAKLVSNMPNSNHLKVHKNTLLRTKVIFKTSKVFLAIGILLVSSLSFCFFLSYSSSGTHKVLPGRTPVNESDLEALTFLYQRLNPLEEGVLSLPGTLDYSYVQQFAGAWKARSIIEEHDLVVDPELQVIWPEDLIDLIHNKNFQYFYAGTSTSEFLDSYYQQSVLGIARKLFPVVFSNSNVTILSTAPINSPVALSDFVVVNLQGLPTDSYSFTVLSSALLGLQYDTASELDLFGKKFGNMIVAEMPSRNQFETLMSSLDSGGTLTVFGVPDISLINQEMNLSDWASTRGNWNIEKTGLLQTNSTGTSSLIYSGQNFTDFTASLSFQVSNISNTDNHLGLIFRYENDQNFYYLYVRKDSITLFKRISGADENLLTMSFDRPLAATRNIGVSITGNRIVILSDGNYLAEYVDSTPLNGTKVGLRTRNLKAIFEDLEIVPYQESTEADGLMTADSSIVANLASMTVNNWSLSEPATTLLYYSIDGEPVAPFLQRYSSGDKMVQYVNIMPFIDALQNSEDGGALDVMKEVLAFLVPLEESSFNNSSSSVAEFFTNYFLGTCVAEGNITVTSSSIFLSSLEDGFFGITVTDPNLGSTEQLVVSSLHACSTTGEETLVIRGSAFSVGESGYFSWVNLYSDEEIWVTSNPNVNDVVQVTLVLNSTYSESFELGDKELKIEIDPEDLLAVKQPTFSVSGNTSFSDTRFYTKTFSEIAKGPTNISGNITFKIDSTAYNTYKLSNLSITGNIDYEPQSFDGLDINWTRVIFSKETLIAFLGLLCAFQSIFIVLQKYEKSSNKSCVT